MKQVFDFQGLYCNLRSETSQFTRENQACRNGKDSGEAGSLSKNVSQFG